MYKRKGSHRYLSASPEMVTTTSSASDQYMATHQDHEDAQLLLQAIKDNTQPVPQFRSDHQGHAAAEYHYSANAEEKALPTHTIMENEPYGAANVGTKEEQELAACLVAMSRSTESPTQASTISTTTNTTTTAAYESDGDSTHQETSSKVERDDTTDESEGESEDEEDGDDDGDEEEEESPPRLPKLEKNSKVRDVWEDRFQELVAFKREFGHANPRVGKCPSLALAQWLKLQRQVFRNDLLDPAQTQLLRELGCEGFEDFQKYNHTYPTSKPKKAVKVKKTVSSKPVFRNVPEGPPNIPEPNKNDVVCGRGASIYRLPGNVQFRSIVASRKLEYIATPDSGKMPIAQEVVAYIRNLDPPGRFIMQHKSNGMWYDVGDKQALKKTAMTLRQDARAIREADAKSTNIVKKVKATTKKEDKKQPSTFSWDDRYRQLLAYKMRVGNANPQRSKVTGKADRELTMWVSEQRKQFREGRLPIERIQALCGAGCNGFDENTDKNTKGKRVVFSESTSGTKRKAVHLAITPKAATKKKSKKVNAVTPNDQSEDSDGEFGSENNTVLPERRQSRSSRFGAGDYRLLSGRSMIHKRGVPR